MAPTKVASKISAWMCANKASGDKGVEPVLVFDRGFARARYVRFLTKKASVVIASVSMSTISEET